MQTEEAGEACGPEPMDLTQVQHQPAESQFVHELDELGSDISKRSAGVDDGDIVDQLQTDG